MLIEETFVQIVLRYYAAILIKYFGIDIRIEINEGLLLIDISSLSFMKVKRMFKYSSIRND